MKIIEFCLSLSCLDLMDMSVNRVSERNVRQCMCAFFVFIDHGTGNIGKRNVPLTNFQSRIHMYPYQTETTAVIGIKPIAIHTS